jgi:DNA-binding CsgD family transcriptional regulator
VSVSDVPDQAQGKAQEARVEVAGTLLRDLRADGGGLLIEGSAGIGKTHVWAEVLRLARDSGTRVLTAQPVEAETRLAGGGLIDLLRDVTDDEIAVLPLPQSQALLAALLRMPSEGAAPDPGVVSVALAAVLNGLADAGPVLVAVDDAQWLDPTTAGAIGYAARRTGAAVCFAITLRTPVEVLPSPAAELEGQQRLRRYDVPALDPATIESIVISRCGREVPRTTIARAIQTSGGNPFYAVELARMWAAVPAGASGALPIPQSLQDLVGARLAGLNEGSTAAVATASALSRPTVATLRAAGICEEDIRAAELAGLLVVDQGRIRFSHPLLAAACYDRLTGTERAALHRRLTEVVDGVETRARHRALGSEGPDEEVAVALDVASDSAIARGDIYAATESARLAVAATPTGSPRLAEREYRLARHLFVSGDSSAQEILERLCLPEVPDQIRGRAQATMSELALSTISHEAAQVYGAEAVETATRIGDDALLADAYIYLAQSHQFEPARARRDARTAQDLLEAQDDPDASSLAKALALSAGIDFNVGLGLDHTRLQRAKDLEDSVSAPAEDRMVGYYVAMCCYADDFDRARELMSEWEALNAAYGYERDLTMVLMWRTTLELATGHFDDAARYAEEHLSYAEVSGQAQAVRYARYNQGQLALHRGDVATAHRLGTELVAEAEAGAGTRIEVLGRRLLGEADLLLGDYVGAAAELGRVEELRSPELRDPSALAHLPKLIEARIALAQPVAEELALYELQARLMDRASALAVAGRCRALVALAEADEPSTIEALDAAVEYHEKAGTYPIEYARTLMVRSRAMRRFRRKAAGREALNEARRLCAERGAIGWVERIDTELAELGGRGGRELDELTSSERKVAELASKGQTNKEIGAALFLSPKTVEVHLTRAYRKLGVRSRTELGARL